MQLSVPVERRWSEDDFNVAVQLVEDGGRPAQFEQGLSYYYPPEDCLTAVAYESHELTRDGDLIITGLLNAGNPYSEFGIRAHQGNRVSIQHGANKVVWVSSESI